MATVTISGASDDLVEIEGIDGADEFYADSKDHWEGILEAPDGEAAIVYVDFQKNGTWTVALGQYEEDHALPSWPQSYASEGYTVIATIEVPEGTTIRERRR